MKSQPFWFDAADTAPAAPANADLVADASALSANKSAGDVGLDDWDTLFIAVTTTLRQSVGTGLLSRSSLEVQGQVLQCVAALEQLRTTMQHQIDRASLLQAELSSAQATLARARSDLASAHASEQTARHQAEHDHATRNLTVHAHFQQGDVASTR